MWISQQPLYPWDHSGVSARIRDKKRSRKKQFIVLLTCLRSIGVDICFFAIALWCLQYGPAGWTKAGLSWALSGHGLQFSDWCYKQFGLSNSYLLSEFSLDKPWAHFVCASGLAAQQAFGMFHRLDHWPGLFVARPRKNVGVIAFLSAWVTTSSFAPAFSTLNF